MKAMDLFLAVPIPMPYLGRVFQTDYNELGIPVLQHDGRTVMVCIATDTGHTFMATAHPGWHSWCLRESSRSWDGFIEDYPDDAANLWHELEGQLSNLRPDMAAHYREVT